MKKEEEEYNNKWLEGKLGIMRSICMTSSLFRLLTRDQLMEGVLYIILKNKGTQCIFC